jgi:hypothetical protein
MRTHNKPSVATPKPDNVNEIQERAYQLFELRGREDGHELDDWLQAEKEINQANLRADKVAA